MRFEFMTAARIVFGVGALNDIGKLAADFGKTALVVTTVNPERANRLMDLLANHDISTHLFIVRGEPTIKEAQEGAQLARRTKADFVVGIGGGSAMDSGKAIAALATNPGDPLNYLEVIGQNQPLTADPLPFIAIPTTAGTGSEVTRNAVLSSPEHRVKVSLRHPLMLAKIALVDPQLTYGLPADLTASTGMDALTQVIEPFTCNAPNPLVDALCREGITRAARSLRKVYQTNDVLAREDMALTSLFGGLALANAKLGAVHGFAGPLGGMYPIPHGVCCACLLPHTMAVNVKALRERDPDGESLRRYTEVARLVTGKPDAAVDDGVAWVQALCNDLRIPPLSDFGITEADFPMIIEKSARASSMKGNAVALTEDEMADILTRAL